MTVAAGTSELVLQWQAMDGGFGDGSLLREILPDEAGAMCGLRPKHFRQERYLDKVPLTPPLYHSAHYTCSLSATSLRKHHQSTTANTTTTTPQHGQIS